MTPHLFIPEICSQFPISRKQPHTFTSLCISDISVHCGWSFFPVHHRGQTRFGCGLKSLFWPLWLVFSLSDCHSLLHSSSFKCSKVLPLTAFQAIVDPNVKANTAAATRRGQQAWQPMAKWIFLKLNLIFICSRQLPIGQSFSPARNGRFVFHGVTGDK